MKKIEGLELEVIGILRRIHNSPRDFSRRDNRRLNQIHGIVKKMADGVRAHGETCERLEQIAKAMDPKDFKARLLPWDMLHAVFSGVDKRMVRKPEADPLEEIYK